MKRDEYLGAVKFEGEWHILALYVGEWILDYQSYDPKFAASDATFDFRGGLLKVDQTNADKFCEVMKEHEFSVAELSALLADSSSAETPLTVLIDFDEKLFVNGFYDLAIEEYVPEGWHGVFGDPLNYLPEGLQKLWHVGR